MTDIYEPGRLHTVQSEGVVQVYDSVTNNILLHLTADAAEELGEAIAIRAVWAKEDNDGDS